MGISLIAAVILGQASSLRPFAQYVPGWLVAPGVVAAVLACVLAVRGLRRGLVRPWWVLAAFGALTLFVAGVLFPIFDARREMGMGSDQDDALLQVAAGLWRGENPFSGLTYLGNPLSPGPLWALAHLPFAAAGVYIAAPVMALAVMAWMIAREGGARAAAIMLAILGTTPMVWEALAIGSDQITIGCVTVVLVLAAGRVTEWRGAAALAVGGAVIATGRIIYPGIPLVMAATAPSAWARWAAVAGAVVGGGIHAALAIGWGQYGPLHLVAQVGGWLPPWSMAAVAALTAATALLAVWARPERQADRLRWTGLCLAVPLGWLVVARSAPDFGDLAAWGTHQALPALMPLAAAAGLAAESDSQ